MKSRILIYKLQGCSFGQNVFLGNVDISLPEQVVIGSNCHIEDYVRLRPGGPWLSSSIHISDDTFIGYGTQINVGSPLKIGKHCMIAPLCIIADAQHGFSSTDIPMKQQKCEYASITICDDVWLGSNVVIVGGITIGTGAIIGAGAVVTRSVPEYEIWAGVPAKQIGKRQSTTGCHASFDEGNQK